MRHKRNILVLVEHAGQGGAEKVAATLAEVLATAGRYHVHYCAMYRPASLPVIPGVTVSTLGLVTGSGLRSRVVRYKDAILQLRHFKRQHDIHLTISNLWPTDWLNFAVGKERKVAVIHCNILNNNQNALMVKAHRLVSFVYKRFKKIILVGSNLESELADFFKIPIEKLQTIHNPVDCKRAAELAREKLPRELEELLTGNQVMVAINRLSAIKNTGALLRIYKELNIAGAKLLIVGEGEEKKSLEATAVSLGLNYIDLTKSNFDTSASVFFLPFQKNVFPILKHAKLFVFPTRGEGIPLVLLEAMSIGCPAIASDCPNGGVSEIMQGSQPFRADKPRLIPERATGGYLMPIPTDPSKDARWVETICTVLQDESNLRRMSQESRTRSADFDISHFSSRWIRLIENILPNNE